MSGGWENGKEGRRESGKKCYIGGGSKVASVHLILMAVIILYPLAVATTVYPLVPSRSRSCIVALCLHAHLLGKPKRKLRAAEKSQELG